MRIIVAGVVFSGILVGGAFALLYEDPFTELEVAVWTLPGADIEDDDTILEIEELARHLKTDAETPYEHGLVMVGLGEIDNAVKFFDLALKDNPTQIGFHSRIYFLQAIAHLCLGDTLSALANCDTALTIAPKFRQAREKQCTLLQRTHQYIRALESADSIPLGDSRLVDIEQRIKARIRIDMDRMTSN